MIHPVQPVLPPVLPEQPAMPVLVPTLNWSHFMPEFADKPEEEAGAHLSKTNLFKTHLLRTNAWKATHTYLKGLKVKILCNIGW